MPDAKPWYKRPLTVIGAVFGGLTALLVLFLIGETIYYFVMFKTGKLKPAEPYRSQVLRASLTEAMKNTPVSADQMKRLESGDNPTLGNPDAKLRIVEFVDYDCPLTKQMAPIVREYMKENADSAYLVIRDYPSVELHPNAQLSAIAARCVIEQNESLYWDYYDWLFANQGSHSVDSLTAGAGMLGLDVYKFGDCLDKRTGWSQIQQGLTDGFAFGVTGTPTFFFNGRVIPGGAMSAEFFKLLADETRTLAEGGQR